LPIARKELAFFATFTFGRLTFGDELVKVMMDVIYEAVLTVCEIARLVSRRRRVENGCSKVRPHNFDIFIFFW
jgi:hypothetical protein